MTNTSFFTITHLNKTLKYFSMKTNKLKITISLFSMLLCIGVFAQRQGGQGGPGGRGGGQGQQRGGKPDAAKILSMLDTNGDNKIDKTEAAKDQRGKISQNFDQIDTNDDSLIDEDELSASLNGRGDKRVSAIKIMKEVDDNRDGKLNQLEIAAKEKLELTNNFEEIDTNQDNELDLEELKVFYSKGDKKKRKKGKRPN